MTTLKLTDATRAAKLLKTLVAKADTNLDGAVRNAEVDSIAGNPRVDRRQAQQDLKSALHGVQRYAMSKGSVTVERLRGAVDELVASVKAADRDRDGKLSETEYRSLSTLAAKRFVDFAASHANDKVSDFQLAPQHEPSRPTFSWKGTTQQVCTSLLNAFSNPKNDNFWPSWGSPSKSPARYVLSATEAKAMVQALEPLYTSRQKGVLTELAQRSARSTFGCVSVDAGARKVFQAYAKRLGVEGLTFGSPAAPKMPSP